MGAKQATNAPDGHKGRGDRVVVAILLRIVWNVSLLGGRGRGPIGWPRHQTFGPKGYV